MQLPEDVENIPDLFFTILDLKPSTVGELAKRMVEEVAITKTTNRSSEKNLDMGSNWIIDEAMDEVSHVWIFISFWYDQGRR